MNALSLGMMKIKNASIENYKLTQNQRKGQTKTRYKKSYKKLFNPDRTCVEDLKYLKRYGQN